MVFDIFKLYICPPCVLFISHNCSYPCFVRAQNCCYPCFVTNASISVFCTCTKKCIYTKWIVSTLLCKYHLSSELMLNFSSKLSEKLKFKDLCFLYQRFFKTSHGLESAPSWSSDQGSWISIRRSHEWLLINFKSKF